jgi:Rps23 Pro-64 3,4-dihydroxylase Tpa1-like proline 4-hydroxylase
VNHFFRVENFLEPEKNREILNWAQNNEFEFIPSSVSTGIEDYRRSDVAFKFPLKSLIQSRVRSILPVALAALETKLICVGDIECQLTATGNGGFFKKHTDSGERNSNRIISYVYYMHSNPKPFTGGELRLYEDSSAVKFNEIEPENNTLILFPSNCSHEVMPVMSNGDFTDSRFTVNGWIREYDELTQPSLLIK